MQSKYPNQALTKLVSQASQVTNPWKLTEEREQWLTQVFLHSNEAIFLIDPDQDKILEVNPSACQLLQYTGRELLALPLSAIFPYQRPRLLAFARTVIEQGQSRTDELRCVARTGNILLVEISAA